MWAVSNAGNPVNLRNAASITAEQVSSDYVIKVYDVDGDMIAQLSGTWATLAEARNAASRLVNAVDPADYA
jgi:hypothetical protein